MKRAFLSIGIILAMAALLVPAASAGPGTHATPTGEFHALPVGHFSQGRNLSGEGDAELRKVLQLERARERGVIPSARVAASVNPTANDLAVSIGGTDFKVVAALGAAGAYVQVLREASAALTYANLVKAINGDSATVGTKWKESTTPFAQSVVADLVTATVLRVRLATARGGTAVAGVSPSMVLAAAVTGGASAWNVANLSASGKALADQDLSALALTITAAMMTATSFDVELPFTPTVVLPQTLVSGVVTVRTDAITISGNAVHVALPGGGGTHFAAGDVLVFVAFK